MPQHRDPRFRPGRFRNSLADVVAYAAIGVPTAGLLTRLCVADPENSVFYDAWQSGDRGLTCERPSNIEGIGRPGARPTHPETRSRCDGVEPVRKAGIIHQLAQRCGEGLGLEGRRHAGQDTGDRRTAVECRG